MSDRFIKLPAAHVLIYPYWNVNKRKKSAAETWMDSFNLSILECKYQCENQQRKDPYGFNLSILECKSSLTWYSLLLFTVLIYPYWNVNELERMVEEVTVWF